MRIGNAPCSWGINYPTGNKVEWAQYLDEVAAAGYRGTELGPFGYFPKDPVLLRDELRKRSLELMGATHVHTFGDTASTAHLVDTLRNLCPLLVALGARHLVIMDEDNWYPRDKRGQLGPAGWTGLVRGVQEAQRIIEGEFGLKASFHPHVGTAVQFEPEIDRLLAETEIDLCLDTGHHAFWNQDPLQYAQRVWSRVAYIHLKNIDPAIRQNVLDGVLSIEQAFAAGVMCALPDGVVDIRAFVELLNTNRFAGPVVVEQDPSDDPADSPLRLAQQNLAYLEGKM